MEKKCTEVLLLEIPTVSPAEIPGFAKIMKKIPIAEMHDELHEAWDKRCRELKINSKELRQDVLANIQKQKLCLFPEASPQSRKKIYNPLEELNISNKLLDALHDLGYYNLCKILSDTEKWRDGNDMKEIIRGYIGEKLFLELNETFEKLEIKKLQKV